MAIDAENAYYWRRPIQRLDAEILRDRMLFASGTLDRDFAGPPVAIKEDDTGQVIVDGQQKRRSIYIRVRRSQPVAMLQSFDAPVMDVNCQRRPVSTVATQSLILLNGEFTLQQADLLAQRIIRETPTLPLAPLPPLPELPKPLRNAWSYGYGKFDDQSARVVDFTELPHWTGSEWQGGDQRPDPDDWLGHCQCERWASRRQLGCHSPLDGCRRLPDKCARFAESRFTQRRWCSRTDRVRPPRDC